ncbi:hypothetical protein HYPSUDRAFT_33983 [Hypholoma sublateritium FD-334 SS-4]|uniref:Uncharacterized protein n=1 Tax=Hypholoma sublateritium (strain FD-334 SS-4) TaxID=945553 RepID=A0A0D2PCF7_HYPSF|nr:hypothetical protein HYPSUDRAFT_33983 [Hypholoma sublateritium FD-334 SS-4]
MNALVVPKSRRKGLRLLAPYLMLVCIRCKIHLEDALAFIHFILTTDLLALNRVVVGHDVDRASNLITSTLQYVVATGVIEQYCGPIILDMAQTRVYLRLSVPTVMNEPKLTLVVFFKSWRAKSAKSMVNYMTRVPTVDSMQLRGFMCVVVRYALHVLAYLSRQRCD